jgi:hypothetical protein
MPTGAIFGALHFAVNNAGVTGTPGPLEDPSVDDWNDVLATDLGGVWYGLNSSCRLFDGICAIPNWGHNKHELIEKMQLCTCES